ncbi:MAG TPA: cation:dicarboxylase symporter family transporter [Flavobacteriales bacterium]|nr:cation:dicarboxylase symporter family transporter [Flavobacteriales bacterium]HNE78981.1 cation:dicarboxylase symporter family transporter [Flavobacteriales bacterium]HNI05210.1 cation:dicarboxylase symporter family transporter [Flavobacteriales bacterium]HNK69188.1 cation:dicarboxylase symporter family transporter [Flavobacteriales bacterium]HNM70086.1 cation:dicarboxylase symporter family transporter [Flavobacteriales bacterium]
MLSKTNRLTLWILIAMVVGIGVGYAMHLGMDVAVRKGVAENLKILTDVFLRLVKMIIAPLVFSTLVVGIAKLGDMRTVGRVGGRALLWFISASLVSLLLGMLLVNLLKPGVGLHLEASGDVSDVVDKTGVFTLRDFIAHLFPSSMVDAMARNEVLQIVVFSVFFGMACASIGDYAKPVVKLLESVAHVILKMVGYVMNFAPLGVFGAIAAVIAIHGLGILSTYAVYIGQFYLGLAILWLLLLGAGFLLLGQRMKELMRRIVQPITIAFSTTSSEAVMPKLMEELERFGCKDKVVSFVLPLGYSFNLDGSMMYMTFASLFIAQVYGITLDFGTQLTMLLTLMLTSKGIAGVPRASLVVVAATLGMFGIPVEGIALILPIDHFCDMGRSATNVVGNAIATSVVSKWEGELGH